MLRLGPSESEKNNLYCVRLTPYSLMIEAGAGADCVV